MADLGRVAFLRPHPEPSSGQSFNGLGESEIAARVGLYRTDTSVLSFQAGLRSPGGSFADSLGPFEVRRAASLDVRGLAGRNVVVAAMEGFVEAQAGYRFTPAVSRANGGST